jgi:hypothetical protein
MPQADIDRVREFLSRAARRVTVLLVLHGVAAGLAVALVIAAAGWITHRHLVPLGIDSLGFVALGSAIGVADGLMRRKRVAAIVERRAPECRNILITAHELMSSAPRIDAYVTDLVFRDAARVVDTLRLPAVLPMRGALTSVTVVATIWVFAATRTSTTTIGIGGAGPTTATVAAVTAVDAEIIAPAYLGAAPSTLHDPARIAAPAGSHVRLTVHADASTLTIELPAAKHVLHESAARTFVAEFVVDSDGFVTLEPALADGRAGSRRLIGLSATPDEPPTVRITAPGHDEKLVNGHHTIDVSVEAADDHALGSLHLHYVKVSGSGERFTFTEGDAPLTITRTDVRNWKGHASWRLDSLALEPGDMVVYRAVATDRRPGATPTESDAFIAEVLAPGGIAAAGFAVDPEVERYALSEQMVILKSEKLLARKSTLAADAYNDEAAALSAEQRSVRAFFVFMMGGEVGGADDAADGLDETAEASGEGDLALQRMLNQGRAALLSAIRSMSRATTALNTADVTGALPHERDALAQIEKTFAHNRIILRALTERERIDLTRRLSGSLTDAARDDEAPGQPDRDPTLTALRKALADVTALANAAGGTTGTAADATDIAERILRVDPSSMPLQRIAAELDSAQSSPLLRRRLLDRAATGLTQLLRARLPMAPRSYGP